MIVISRIDPSGSNDSFVLRKYRVDSDLFDSTARLSKTKTLDGGVVIVTSGYVELDLSYRIITRMSEARAEALKDVYKSDLYVIFTNSEGVYEAAIASFNEKYGEVRMTIEPLLKLSA